MDFNSRLKGKITQSLIECLLEDAKLKVMSLGIEEIIREVKALTREQYLATNLSKNLRTLPDFFVSDIAMSKTWLVEVKYRKCWNEHTRESIFKRMKGQVETWKPLVLVIFLGEPVNTDTPASFVRVLQLTIKEDQVCMIKRSYKDPLTDKEVPESYIPWDELNWIDFARIQDFFPNPSAKESFEANTLRKATSLVKKLSEIDLLDE